MSVDEASSPVRGRKVEDDLLSGHRLARELPLAEVAEPELDRLDAVGEIFQPTAREVVGDSDAGAGLDEPVDEMAADERRAARDKHAPSLPCRLDAGPSAHALPFPL